MDEGSAIETGFPLEIFPHPPHEGLHCVACCKVLRKPLQTVCAHRICKNCYESRAAASSDETIPCPGCNTALSNNDVFPDKFAEREAKSLLSICVYNKSGCTWKGDLNQHEAHVKGCSFNPDFKRRSGPDNATVSDSRLIPIRLLKKISAGGKCPFKNTGCSFEGNAVAMHEHLEDTLVDHMQKVSVIIFNLRRSQVKLNDVVQQEIDNQKKIKLLEDQLQCQAARMKTLEAQVSFVKQDRDRMNEIVDLLNNAGIPASGDFMRVEEEIRQLRDFISNQSSVSAVTDPSDGKVVGRFNMQHTMTLLENETAQQSINLANMNLRLCLLQSTSYDGVLMWRIDSLPSRIDDAVSGKIPSLFSPPFFTQRFGYRLCARIYLNGDGKAKGENVSLFVVMMRGEYDDILQWPFRRKITFTLIDQKSGTNHLVKSFHTDPASSSFKQPDREMNIASGCPYFLQHSKLFKQDKDSSSRKILPDCPYVLKSCLILKVVISEK